MNERTELESEVERARVALTRKVHMLEARVKVAKERVDHALDVPAHYREHAWAFVACAFAAGVLTGWRSPAPAARR